MVRWFCLRIWNGAEAHAFQRFLRLVQNFELTVQEVRLRGLDYR